ncbi:enoyl-CoA hydratase-related protein [Fodinicola feengrottensis]|uniref:Enoyl-CoA hydratase-related protein n=1 Tax=Fodinicola feengrottensis TaxID=435914 RepID=A0ABN2IK01_9ACTN
MSDSLIVDRTEAVATVTLNRPKAMNALNLELKEALKQALTELAADRAVRAIVLTGAGDRAFCVGQDLREHLQLIEAKDPAPLSTVTDHYNPITLALAQAPKPVIAAVRGTAAGAGASFAYAADFRLGGPSTSFLMAFANIGLTADSGASWTLQRLVGYAKAIDLMMVPRKVEAAEALELGLLTTVMDDDNKVLMAAQQFAARIAAGPTVAYAQIKRSLAFSATHSLADSLALEAQAQATAGATADHAEAVAAFVAKRQPNFRGE